MAGQRLQDTRRVVLNASGLGTVTFGPQRSGQRYVVKRISVSAGTAVLEAQAKIYRGTVSPSSFISGTLSGSTGDTEDGLTESLWSGEYLSVQWTGGDVGATATATFWGDIEFS